MKLLARIFGYGALLLWALTALLIGAQLALAATPMQQAREVVLMLISGDVNVPAGCSAVVIAPDKALTAAHCLGIPDMQVVRADGWLFPVFNAFPHPVEDIAILNVPGLRCPCAAVSSAPAEIDEEAYAVGFPYGIGSVLTVGHIQGRVVAPDGRAYLLASPNVNPGNSGGGLFVVREGSVYLVGILVLMVETGSPLLAVEVMP